MDVSGAGDTFLSALALNYLTNKDIVMAIEFANQIAGEVVRKRGVASI
jgi:sugar/nucleoside kinase (ribokinase family)